MATITIPNGRLHSDIRAHVALKDNGVAIDWTGLTEIRAYLYSTQQKLLSGRFTTAVNQDDATDLVCDYSADLPQYEGLNRIVIRCVYEGRTKTYDAALINLVPSTDNLADDPVVLEDPEVDVTIEVTEVSTSLLDEAINAAFDAAEAAMAAAGHTPYIGANGNWYVWDYTLNQYVDTEKPSRGPTGATGATGATGPTGADGKSIYQLAVDHGYTGTEEEFVAEYNASVAAANAAAELAAAKAALASSAASAANTAAEQAAIVTAAAAEAATAADEAADNANEKAQAAEDAAAAVTGAAEAATEAAALATEKAEAAADAAEAASAAASEAETQGDYAKDQGDYAKGEIDGAKGDFDSLNERFEATENAAIFIDETTDPSDDEYQDEYQRVLSVLYQAIEDAKAALRRQAESIADTEGAADGAMVAADKALAAAEAALTQATAASRAAEAALAAAAEVDTARGGYDSLESRLEAIEAGKQDTIQDLQTIREGAHEGSLAYQKPDSGIPKTDLASGVQASLGKADTAIQFEESDDPSSLID